jgi:hypothetical protein
MQFKDDVEAEGGLFVKLKDKQSIKGIFRGEIFDFKQHWTRSAQGDRSQVCKGQGCPICAVSPKKPTFKFRVNFVTTENGAFIARIFESNAGVYVTLRDMAKAGYNLEKTKVQITRNGEGRDTKYTILPVANSPLTTQHEQEIAKVVLHDLTQMQDASQGARSMPNYESTPPSGGSNFGDDDIPF